MAEESSNECMPLDLSMKAEATQRTSRDGTQGASSTLGAYRTISDDALRYPGNTQHTPTTDETCNVDGMRLKPEEESSKCPTVPVERLPADGTPHTVNPTNVREAQRPSPEHAMNRLSRSRTTNARHAVNC
ncbi:uncharacterized protein [Dermacentor albipictus]|uniref:uncharacterized protein n=1 Tax=Dermacentor albipictus TaxID=60249 RepID=UPI0038FC8C3E